ncbi:MAG: site-2 protease family protein [Peptococcia bacterium]
MFNFNIESLIISIPAVLLALSFHEFAHGYVAYRLGDPTPKIQGRLTLNPLAHLDLLGTLMMFIARFGWAKPVQVNPLNFKGDRMRGMMLVSLAGPLSNILIAFIGLLLYNLLGVYAYDFIIRHYRIELFLITLIYLNVYLSIFNLIPLPPLDGSKILLGILPRRYYNSYFNLERYAPIILILLILTGITSRVLAPIAALLIGLLDKLAYLIVTIF